MRSALTMLGIIIGVGAVITMLAVGTGARERISEQMASIGSNLLMVMPGSSTSGGLRMGSGTQSTLTQDDAEAIARECPAVSDVAPTYNGAAQVVYGNQNWSTGIVGTTPGILPSGTGRSPPEGPSRSRKCAMPPRSVSSGRPWWITSSATRTPWARSSGSRRIPFTVIGVLDKKGQSDRGQDQDDTIYVPLTTAQKKIFGTPFAGMVRIIAVKAKSADDWVRRKNRSPNCSASVTGSAHGRRRISRCGT